jgi:hypothetical protein
MMKSPKHYASAAAFRVALESRLKGMAQKEALDLQRLRRQATVSVTHESIWCCRLKSCLLSWLALQLRGLLLLRSNVAPAGQHFCRDTGRVVG